MFLSKFIEYKAIILALEFFNIDPTSVSNNQLKELNCLTENVFYESRFEDNLGQIAVAHVTINRTKHDMYPNTICNVVWQSYQFSWTIWKDTKFNEDFLIRRRDGNDIHAKPLNEFYRSAKSSVAAYFNIAPDPTKGAKYYYNPHIVNPVWARSKRLEPIKGFPNGIIGNHRFLREKR